jgi:hypothetical protein
MRRRKMVEIVIFMEFQCALETQPLFEIRKFAAIPMNFSTIAKSIRCYDEV